MVAGKHYVPLMLARGGIHGRGVAVYSRPSIGNLSPDVAWPRASLSRFVGRLGAGFGDRVDGERRVGDGICCGAYVSGNSLWAVRRPGPRITPPGIAMLRGGWYRWTHQHHRQRTACFGGSYGSPFLPSSP